MREKRPAETRRKESKRHPHKALTPREVSAIREPGRYADGGGLYLLVAPSGSKSWMLRTLVHGRRRDLGLGGAGVVSLAEAREHAHRLRKVARAGGDPLAQRRSERRAVPSFAEAARQFHASVSSGFKNEKHRKQWLASLGSVFEAFGAHRVDAVSSADVLAALSADWLKTPETSRRVLQRVRAVFEWAKAQGFRSGDNPAEGLTKVLPPQRRTVSHHAALPYADVPAFLTDLRGSDAGEVVKLAFEFTVLTAARTSEALHAKWSEFDLKAKTWTVPAARMKANVEHRVPLAPRCLKVLEAARGLADGGDYVFPGRRRSSPLSNMVFLMTLRRMGRDDLTAHGFRSSFRDWAAERTHVPSAVCEAALAHVVRNRVEAAYNRTDLFERRQGLMSAWAKFCVSR